jgi:import inner membrane translocase subunit TIM9
MSKQPNIEALQQAQIRVMIKNLNELVTMCFDNCIYNFKTRKLDNSEELCLSRCTEKYMRIAQRVSKVISEQQLLILQQQTPE